MVHDIIIIFYLEEETTKKNENKTRIVPFKMSFTNVYDRKRDIYKSVSLYRESEREKEYLG